MPPPTLEYRSQEIPSASRIEMFCYLAPGCALLLLGSASVFGSMLGVALGERWQGALGFPAFIAFVACFPAFSACLAELRRGHRWWWLRVAAVLNGLPVLLTFLLLAAAGAVALFQ